MTRQREDRPAGNGPAPNSNSVQAGGQAEDSPPEVVFVAGLRGRRRASWRSEPLLCGRRDPADPHPSAELLDDAELASWLDAIGHLAALGYPALVPAEVADQLAVTR